MVYTRLQFVYSHKLSKTVRPMGEGKSLKLILTYFNCTKYNETILSNSHIQRHVSYKKLYKKFTSYAYRLTQVFRCIVSYGGNFFECFLFLLYLYSIEDNEINIGHSDVKYHASYKNGLNISYTGSYKIIRIHCGQ